MLGQSAPAPGDVEALRYATQVVDEALRLYPPGHILVRSAVEDTEVQGYLVPSGRIVVISIWGIHHSPSVWPDPHRFAPDRSVATDRRVTERSDTTGTRTCPSVGDHAPASARTSRSPSS